jgi:ribosomal protein S12 methylthiotransferase
MVAKTFHLVSLGCAKNTVDSESMAQILAGSGYRAVEKPARASVLIVNTCGFIGPARKIPASTGRAGSRQTSRAGADRSWLPHQRYGVEVAQRVPGIDASRRARWMDILEVVKRLRKGSIPSRSITCRIRTPFQPRSRVFCDPLYREPVPT